MNLPAQAYQTVQWREGTAKALSSRFAAVRVRSAHGETHTQRAEERTGHLRWRIERDFQELKDELGLDHFEGRTWRGFHHHAALCIATYAFIASERGRFSPSAGPTLAIVELSANHRSSRSSNHY